MVLAQEAGEALEGGGPVLFGLADPLVKEVAAPVSGQFGKGAGQVAGGGDVRADDADLVELVLLVAGQRVARGMIGCPKPLAVYGS